MAEFPNQKMNRREFFKHSSSASLVATSVPAFGAGSAALVGSTSISFKPAEAAVMGFKSFDDFVKAAAPYGDTFGGAASVVSLAFSIYSERKKRKLLEQINSKLDEVLEHIKKIEKSLKDIEIKLDFIVGEVQALRSEIAEDRRVFRLEQSYRRIKTYGILFETVHQSANIADIAAQIADLIALETHPKNVPLVIKSCEVALLISHGKVKPVILDSLLSRISDFESALESKRAMLATNLAACQSIVEGPYVASVKSPALGESVTKPSEVFKFVQWHGDRTKPMQVPETECEDIDCNRRKCKTVMKNKIVPDSEFNNGKARSQSIFSENLVSIDKLWLERDVYELMISHMQQYANLLVDDDGSSPKDIEINSYSSIVANKSDYSVVGTVPADGTIVTPKFNDC